MEFMGVLSFVHAGTKGLKYRTAISLQILWLSYVFAVGNDDS